MAEQIVLIRAAATAERAQRTLSARAISYQSRKAVKRRGYRALLADTGVETLEFQVFGAVCKRDQYGEHFNFPQRWTPYPGVAMSTLFGDSPQTLTLALNLLDCFLRAESPGKQGIQPSVVARELAGSFAEDILAPIAGSGWHLPLETLRNWINSHDPRVLRRP